MRSHDTHEIGSPDTSAWRKRFNGASSCSVIAVMREKKSLRNFTITPVATMSLCWRRREAVYRWGSKWLPRSARSAGGVRGSQLGVPWQPELAMGAIASGGVRVLNEEVIRALHIPDEVIEEVTEEEWQELTRREATYRDDRGCPELIRKTSSS